jgi:hypothetical protein
MIILFPSFDDYLALILDGAEELSRGEYTRAERSLQCVYAALRRIGSNRHCRLAGFVHLALLSCADRDYSGAMTVLLASVGLFEEESHAVATRAMTRAPVTQLRIVKRQIHAKR